MDDPEFIEFETTHLLSKWGFNDGDLLRLNVGCLVSDAVGSLFGDLVGLGVSAVGFNVG